MKKTDISNDKDSKKQDNLKNPTLKKIKSIDPKKYPTIKLKSDRDIAMDFAEKLVRKFDTLVKTVILFGSAAKDKTVPGSDIDIIIVVDDATLRFDEKFIMWYREELGKIIQKNPYKKDLHINTVKLTTWWDDLRKGDPTIINIIRYGETLMDVGGFFNPLKILLQDGRIRPTPESIHTVLNRVPGHILRSRVAEMSAIEGCYWAFVESAQAILMAIKVLPPSPELIPVYLKEHFVNKGILNSKTIKDFQELHELHKGIIHGEIRDIDGKLIDEFQNKSEEFFKKTVKILNDILD
jgi:predicted nucleotidyltransferase